MLIVLAASIRKNMVIDNSKKRKNFSRKDYNSIDDDDDEDVELEMGTLNRSGSRSSVMRNSRVHNYSNGQDCRDCKGVCVCANSSGGGSSGRRK